MKHLAWATLAFVFAVTASAQPTINSGGILNVASYALAGLPNSSIAQGSIFAIFGSGLGPSTLAEATKFPISTTLGGTSVTISAGGQTLQAPIIYTTASQVAVILPSTTPIGSATAAVTYQGATSAAQSFQVVASSFGIFSLNQQGSGTGIVTNTNYQVFLPTSTALAGDAAIIWGTGLGPVSSDVNAPTPGNLSTNVAVYVGGQQAQVSYKGRSGCCSGLDQIVFTVPSGVIGCSVPVVVVTNGNIVSNTTTTPIGTDASRLCSDPTGLSATQLGVLQSKGTLKLGYIGLDRTTNTNNLPAAFGGGTTTSDSGSASFVEFTPTTYAAATNGFQIASVGSCLVYDFKFSSTSTTLPITLPVGLDAGPDVTITGPNGTMQLPQDSQTKGSYDASLSSGSPPNETLYLSPGSYTINNGSGGADVGAFTVNLTVNQPLTWTNMSTIVTNGINRASGVTVDWTGGSPGTYVTISGGSIMEDSTGTSGVFAFFSCLAPVSAGSFTLGPNVLLQLPASTVLSEDGITISLSSLSVGNGSMPTQFSAPGLDYGFASSTISTSASVTYQ
jgi:uncharacterized protein (TIGR03437 family)